MTPPLKVFIIAGEPSGDALGGALMEGLKRKATGVSFDGIGGPLMTAAGLASRFNMSDLSVMGLTEVLPKLPNLLRRIRETAKAVVAQAPDVLITIDSPDFCLRVAKAVKRQVPELPIVHYVAPSVWAWRPGRAAKMAKQVDHVLALLPFEPPYMEAAGMSCDFVGHPVANLPVATAESCAALRADLGIGASAPVLCVLPGSRSGEVKRHGPVFAEAVAALAAKRPDLEVIVPAAAHVAAAVSAHFDLPRVHVLDPSGLSASAAERRKFAAFATADAALAASGTVSLELARQNTPMVIGYKMAPVTQFTVQRMFKAKSATLVNLVSDTMAVPEYFFENCNAAQLVPALERALGGDPAQEAAMAQTMALLTTDKDAAARSVLRFLGRAP